ncbi:hypothetical protein ACWDA7_37610 [Streptomyces sp. NPDC001156]
MQERREERAVRPGELRLVDLPLQHGQLVAQRQDLSILVAIAHRRQSYQGEHARQSQVGQSQQHRTILEPARSGQQSTSDVFNVIADWQDPQEYSHTC